MNHSTWKKMEIPLDELPRQDPPGELFQELTLLGSQDGRVVKRKFPASTTRWHSKRMEKHVRVVIPVVPHKAVAEVPKVSFGRGWLL